MRFLTPIIAVAAMFSLLTIAPPAFAQRNQGASVVVLNYENMITSSDIGRDMTTKLTQLNQQMQAELQPEAQTIQQEQQSLQQATTGMTPQQIRGNSSLNARVEALQQRIAQFRTRETTAARDYEYTRQMTLADFNRQITPMVQGAMESRGAGIVVDAAVTRLVLPGANITDDVVQRLNQQLRSINVTRQTAPAAPTGQ